MNFRLVCRDTVETTQIVSTDFKPLYSSVMQWRLAGAIGNTTTDSDGFGSVQVISTRSIKAERFILILGTRSLGVEVGEIRQIVLPRDWCSGLAAN